MGHKTYPDSGNLPDNPCATSKKEKAQQATHLRTRREPIPYDLHVHHCLCLGEMLAMQLEGAQHFDDSG
jgi:hypothetical protein